MNNYAMPDMPADVPSNKHDEYSKNYQTITKGTNRLFLFAGDQKIEHLQKDFIGPAIDPAAINPEYLFAIASQAPIGVFATHLGLIARYGNKYPAINYLVKLNSKTDCVKTDQKDPLSTTLWSVDDVVQFKKQSGLPIHGIGYTVYVGSEFEHIMLAEAAQAVYQAHSYGLVSVLWMYPGEKPYLMKKMVCL